MKMIESVINKGLTMEKNTTISSDDFLIYLKPHKQKLFNFIQKYLKFSEDAEDLYQNVIFNAYKAIHKFKGKSTFKTWLFSIASNEIYRYYKKKKKDDYQRDVLDNNQGYDKDPDRELINSLFEIALKFDQKYRNVFFLFYYNGFSIVEITGITCIKNGTVKYILNYCREKIKNNLKEA